MTQPREDEFAVAACRSSRKTGRGRMIVQAIAVWAACSGDKQTDRRADAANNGPISKMISGRRRGFNGS